MVTPDLDDFLDAEQRRLLVDLPDLGSFSWQNSRTPLVLIAQIQRSGGTLLSRLLDGHSQLQVYPHELSWNPEDETRWPDVPAGSSAATFEWMARSHVRLARRFQSGYDKYGRNRGAAPPLPYIYNMALHRRLFIETDPSSENRIATYLAAFFGAWLDYRDRHLPKRYAVAFGKRHNLDPSPSRFFRDFPDGRVITLVRRPDQWLASAQQHQPKRYEDAIKALGQWSASATASLWLAKHYPGRVLLATFDDLIGRTAETLERILEWLDLPPEPVCLEPTFNSMPVHSNSAFVSVPGIDSSPLHRRATFPIPANTMDLYRHVREAEVEAMYSTRK